MQTIRVGCFSNASIKVKTQNFLDRYDELQRVEFERTGGTSRSFDIKITNVHDITYTFSSIGE